MADIPWLFRTYAGHSTAAKSNALYKANLEKGQTGLSVAFDLPTQTGYDSDHILARGEVGKVGVPVCHIGDMRALFDAIPIEKMNTSMTINACAAWLLALYIAVADEQGAPRNKLNGTTQNDILKEYLSRGTYIFPPRASMKLTRDVILYTTSEIPRWNPMNVCSYHLQEAGATPEQELAFALANAIAILDEVKPHAKDMGEVVGRISFFVNAGMKLITEICKMRAFGEMWEEILKSRYGVTNEKQTLFRYGVQVNSLGLTEQQPENNVYRILTQALAVTLSKKARARAVQLPAWNEALGLPRPFDQQWSLRMQQIMAYETDILEFEDIFDGSPVIAAKVAALKTLAYDEIEKINSMGGAVEAVENAYMKQELVKSNVNRMQRIERDEQAVIGVNRFTTTEISPLTTGEGTIMVVDPADEAAQIASLQAWRQTRNKVKVSEALEALRQAALKGENIMPPSINAAKAGVTTGEWADVLREIYGEYRAPTGVSPTATQGNEDLDELREKIGALSLKLGRRPKFLVGKPGLDGHSNGAEQIATRARDIGMDVVYNGIRLTPEAIVQSALKEKADLIGLSILSGSHIALAQDILNLISGKIPVIVGGIIPENDAKILKEAGVAAVYTPKDFKMNDIMADMIAVLNKEAGKE